MVKLMETPAWAEVSGENVHGMLVVDVDADAGYEAVLAEYREFYADEDNHPNEWLKADGDLRVEFAEMLDELGEDDLSQYWLEVAYQTMKMDLWAALGNTLEIRMHSAEKPYAQSKHPGGRGVAKATGGIMGPQEARHHYRRLRGFFPG